RRPPHPVDAGMHSLPGSRLQPAVQRLDREPGLQDLLPAEDSPLPGCEAAEALPRIFFTRMHADTRRSSFNEVWQSPLTPRPPDLARACPRLRVRLRRSVLARGARGLHGSTMAACTLRS